MGVSVNIEVSGFGLQETLKRIGALQERLNNPEPGLELVADALEAHAAAMFATQGARAGTRWAPLKWRTVQARAKRWGYYRQQPTDGAGPATPVLVWTGRLRGSYRRGSPFHVREVSSSGLVWGTSLDYAGYHPDRPVLAFADDFQKRELVFQPFRLWLQGAEPGAIRTVMASRTGLRFD